VLIFVNGMIQEEFLCQGRLNDPSLDLSLNNPLSQVSSLSVPYRWYLLGFLMPYFRHFRYRFKVVTVIPEYICHVYICGGSEFKLFICQKKFKVNLFCIYLSKNCVWSLNLHCSRDSLSCFPFPFLLYP